MEITKYSFFLKDEFINGVLPYITSEEVLKLDCCTKNLVSHLSQQVWEHCVVCAKQESQDWQNFSDHLAEQVRIEDCISCNRAE